MKPETPFHAPLDGCRVATRIVTPHPVHDGVGNGVGDALKAAYPAPQDDMGQELAQLLERLH